ncbi:hypothetical protein THAOC_23457 [Thalassiosira oceanica]|uniref:Uncharacterized protein n=1 Tax=Thalassiosira oceanica TaxID=159749 RepID=K0S6V9_THAOC|nr:hypothetical protein THAOC_23457 [Thalassiosira oceanica]|eukprot:EJK56621.1 hypothetical protein THAOC_23457 [Thalassiosira oceanica]
MLDELATVPLRRRAPSDARVDATAAWSEMNRTSTSSVDIDTATTNDGLGRSVRRRSYRPADVRSAAPARLVTAPPVAAATPFPVSVPGVLARMSSELQSTINQRAAIICADHHSYLGRGAEKPAFGP